MLQFEVDVDTSGLEHLGATVRERIRIGMVEAVQRGAVVGRDSALRGKFKDQTGRLRYGITANALSESAGNGGSFSVEWVFQTKAAHSWFVEFPTKAHWIRPREARGFIGPLLPNQTRRDRVEHAYPQEHWETGNQRTSAVDKRGRNRALKFFIGGKTIFRAKVWHPGTPGTYFMTGAREEASETTERLIFNIIDSLGNLV